MTLLTAGAATNTFIGANLQQPAAARSTGVPWWLEGGIDPANCIGAYQGYGMASFADSLVNLAHPGTYDLTPTATPPDWTAWSGWTGKTGSWLDTGIVVTGAGWTMIARAAMSQGANRALFSGKYTAAPRFEVRPWGGTALKTSWAYGTIGASGAADRLLNAATYALAGKVGYINGVADINMSTATWSGSTGNVLIGARQADPVTYEYDAPIYFAAIYDTTLSEAQIQAIGTKLSNLAPTRLADMHVFRRDANTWLVRIPIVGDTRMAEYVLSKVVVPIYGLAWASESWSLSAANVVDPTFTAGDIALIPVGSTNEYAMRIGPDDNAAQFEYYGGHAHQNVKSATWSLLADGVDITTAPAGYLQTFTTLTTDQTDTIVLPYDHVTEIGEVALQRTFDATGCLVEHQHDYTDPTPYQITASYGQMMMVATSATMNRYRFDGGAWQAVIQDGLNYGNAQATVMEAGSTAHAYQIALTLPSGFPEETIEWAYSAPYYTYFKDNTVTPATPNGKFYAVYVDMSDFANRKALRDSSHTARYHVTKAGV